MRWSFRSLAILCLLLLLVACEKRNGTALELGDWQLATPDGERHVTLPSHFAGLAEPSRYLLRSRVELPPALVGQPLSLSIPLFYGRAELYVDDERTPSSEALDESAYRAFGPRRWRIPATSTHDGVVELEFRVEHTWTQSAWFDSVPRLSTDLEGDSAFRTRRAVYLFGSWGALATLLTVGFTYGAVYLFDRRRTAHFWFALATFTAAAYPLFNLGWSEPLGQLEVPLLGIALALAPVAAIRFTHVEFELGPVPRVILLLPLIVVFPAFVFHHYFDSTTWLAPLALGAVAVSIGYELINLGRLVDRGAASVNARIILCCWVLLTFSLLNDMLAWLGFGDALGGVRTGGLGLMAFALLQSVALSREHILMFRRAEKLNVELAARIELLERRQHEIVHLNEELQHQIAERSRDLVGVLDDFILPRSNAPSLIAGDVVAGRYRVEGEIGSGGMGRVYRVARLADGQVLALKIMTGPSDRARAARFAREAQLISEINHPNVVRTVDVGVEREGLLYLVMEYISGSSLRECKERYGDVPWALAVLEQLAEALSALHRHDIVHRDVKPGNVLVSGEADAPLAKLTDFGIATMVYDEPADAVSTERIVIAPGTSEPSVWRSETPRLRTETGILMGTPLYMAPELWNGLRRATAAADIFAFGVIAYELLSGSRPFLEPPAKALERGSYEVPALLGAPVPVALAKALQSCLSVVPTERPSAAALGLVIAEARAPFARTVAGREVQISHNIPR
jgi:hypothetical protein